MLEHSKTFQPSAAGKGRDTRTSTTKEKRLRTRQAIFDSMPAAISEIKGERLRAAIELKQFLAERDSVSCGRPSVASREAVFDATPSASGLPTEAAKAGAMVASACNH
jgi:hypothetical protein